MKAILLLGLSLLMTTQACAAERCPNWLPQIDTRVSMVRHCWGAPYGTRSLTTRAGATVLDIYYRAGKRLYVYSDGTSVTAFEDAGPGYP